MIKIDVIGYSGSGKTNFITNAIKQLKKNFDYNIAVIKNVKHHPVDEKGKDSYRFTKVGAVYSVIQNFKSETAIFLKEHDKNIDIIQSWLKNGPYNIDILFTEGFRNLKNPTVLCISNLDEIEEQLTENVKMISGVICSKAINKTRVLDLQIIDIESQFSIFLDLFNIG
ncbi:MAG: molybdopterin-guanine dinucleotide biosynthesis protein B [Promethearchaeota archaeon]